MRINAHAHIFNLRSVLTPETMHIFLNRLKLEGMPKSVLDVLYQRLEGFLRSEICAESIFKSLDESAFISGQVKAFGLRDIFAGYSSGGRSPMSTMIGGFLLA